MRFDVVFGRWAIVVLRYLEGWRILREEAGLYSLAIFLLIESMYPSCGILSERRSWRVVITYPGLCGSIVSSFLLVHGDL